jgi:hypothetical protein
MLDRSPHRQLAAGEPRFADAAEAFVGVHDHEQIIPLSTPHQVGLDAGYLHTYLQVPLANDGTRESCFKQPATRFSKSGGAVDVGAVAGGELGQPLRSLSPRSYVSRVVTTVG